ncbi:MAG: hypothetical protein HY291_22090 [Planctomycetes bacterium]|nr:hypothetical protein [Planctomycetota bacterium]
MKRMWLLGFLCMGLAALMVTRSVRAEEDDDDGKEEVVAVDKVPEAVLKAAKEAVKDIVITKAEKETKGGKVVYELDGNVGEKLYEVVVSAEGKVLKTKEETKAERDDDGKEGKGKKEESEKKEKGEKEKK